jgi:competence protein ComGB
LPLLGNLVKTYITAYFAREWGLLISQGLEFRRVLEIMTTTSSRIFKEAGEKILHQMQMGHTFSGEVERLRFFTPELALMIEYGEMKAKLGLELALYADECWESFFQRCDRLMALIQPLVFLFVAMMIVLIYAAMLLPIYSSMNMGF